MSTPLLSVHDLRVTIVTRGKTVRAVDGVSFSLDRGQTLALVGESGSGKSMTAMSLVGLAPVGISLTTSGKASFEGAELLSVAEAELQRLRGRRIGVIFQDPAAALDPLMTVGDQLREAVPRMIGGWRARVANLLAEVGLDTLPHVERRYPHELSGGQQQRIAIAMALAADPVLLIADEPTTALDMSVQGQILDLLDRLQRARGMAMLLITHDLGIVARHASEVLVLRHGQVVEGGPTRQVLERPQHAYTRALIDSRPRLGEGSPRQVPRQQGDLLKVEHLSVSYPGAHFFSPRQTAVETVDLYVKPGEALGIVGESGSGKSTLAKALVGLVRTDAGTFSFRDAALEPMHLGPAQRARIQYIFQDSYGALNPRMTVEQALAEPLVIAAVPGRERRGRTVKLMQEVGLAEELLTRFPRELSGGQRQRVNIARALALSPDLLICDEIVSALDVSVQAQVLALLRELQRTRGLSLIFISHDLAVVCSLCHRVLVMRHGQVVEQGTTQDLLRAPISSYSHLLLEAARALEFDPPQQEPIVA